MKLEIDNIELSFENRKILYGVYLQAESGMVTGILGRNGCGKTSLLRILFGSLKPKFANIRLNGFHQKEKLYLSDSAAYLPQHQLLPNTLKLGKAFDFFKADWSRFMAVFPSFHGYRNTKINLLSSGEVRVAETYLILQSNKPFILLDEPFSFISPVYVEKIIALIKIKKHKSGIIITDHFYRDILKVSDSVYFLKDGCSKLIKSHRDLENEGYITLD
ncbi:MAG TPA: ABC transporter ATP-binding protein [Pricia antarctica]|uniref:ABC transporter ATP-binding protein n=2 Tax=root TaxID=1 RepID=A0A831QLM4_9FLAO|nr:ABC transporter ATP-binding protein [Pricia antarctica]